jgi:uncharacterized repeat protein (TIGR02543 family)
MTMMLQGGERIYPPTFTRQGYTFTGWSLSVPTFAHSDATYTAQWEKIQYTITCNLNNGSANTMTNYYVDSDTFTLDNPTHPNPNAVFAGWTGTGLTVPTKTVTINKGSIGNLYFTAVWSVNYTVNHNLQNINKTVYPSDLKVTETLSGQPGSQTLARAKTYEGFTAQPFTQTAIASDGTTVIDIYYTRNQYSIIFMSEGSVVGSNNNVPYGGTVAGYIPSPTRSGYVLSGWSPAPPATMPASNLTFTAQWIVQAASYTITYDLDGGSVATANPTSYTAESADITLNNPIKSGYEFEGWTWDEQAEPQASVTIPSGSTGDRAYTANWTIVDGNYELTIMLGNDYTGEDLGQYGEPLSVAAHSVIQLPSGLAKTGYQLLWEWDTDGDGNNDKNGYVMYNSQIRVDANENGIVEISSDPQQSMPESNVTLYLYYHPISYDIVFDANGAKTALAGSEGQPVDMSSLTMEGIRYDEPVRLPGNLSSDYTGYFGDDPYAESVIVGWGSLPDNNTVNYHDTGDFVMNLTHGPDLADGTSVEPEITLTMYAYWKPVDGFGVFDSKYSVSGQVLDYDGLTAFDPEDEDANWSVLNTRDASINATTGAGLVFESYGYFRLKETGNSANPIAIYAYDSDGKPYMPYTYDEGGNLITPEDGSYDWLTTAPAPGSYALDEAGNNICDEYDNPIMYPSQIGSGNINGLGGSALTNLRTSLQSKYGAHWAQGLMTVGHITALWHVAAFRGDPENPDEPETNDPSNDFYGFVFESVNGVKYFISGTNAFNIWDYDIGSIEITNDAPTMEDIKAVLDYSGDPVFMS